MDGTAAPGLLASSTRYANGAAYTTAITGYDSGSRPLGQAITIPASEGRLAGTYTLSNTYRADGELDTSTLPAVGGLPQETLRYGYDALGLPTTLAGQVSYVTGTSYTGYGEEQQVTYSTGGSWLRRDFRYELGTRRLALAETRRQAGAQLIAAVSYGYDAAGNVTRIADSPDPATGAVADVQCFRHDYLRRLVEAWTPGSGDCAAAPSSAALGGPAPYWHAWTLDAVGNRLAEARTARDGTRATSTYRLDGPHRLGTVTTAGPSGTKVDEYGYDPAGNLTTRTRAGAKQALEWDAEGRLAKVTEDGKATSYVYDATGERLIRRDPSGTTLYLPGTELHLDSGGGLAGTRYYSHAGHTIAGCSAASPPKSAAIHGSQPQAA